MFASSAIFCFLTLSKIFVKINNDTIKIGMEITSEGIQTIALAKEMMNKLQNIVKEIVKC